MQTTRNRNGTQAQSLCPGFGNFSASQDILCPHNTLYLLQSCQPHVPHVSKLRIQLLASDRPNVPVPDTTSHLSPGCVDTLWTQTELPNLPGVLQGPRSVCFPLSGCSCILFSIRLTINIYLFIFHTVYLISASSFVRHSFLIWPSVMLVSG